MRQERVHPVDDLDHKGLHLCIRDARDLGPRNFAERGHHLDVAEVSRKAVRRRSGMRSEERRVGKEWVGTCRSRWLQCREKENRTKDIRPKRQNQTKI